MALKEFVYGLIKILAAWILIVVVIPHLSIFSTYFLQTSRPDSFESFFQSIIYLSLYIVASIVLWFYADKISSKVAEGYPSHNETKITESRLRQNKVLEVGFILLGAYVLVFKIPAFFTTAINVIQYPDIYPAIQNIIDPLMPIILAVCLILGRKGIIKIIMRLRSAGIDKQNHQVQN